MPTYRILFVLPAALLIMLACNFTTPSGDQAPLDQGQLYTAAASTLSVQLTQGALASTATSISQPATATSVSGASATPLASNTPAASVTPLPTVTPFPTATRVPPTPKPLPCLAVKFVRDVTVPDGTKYLPGTSFTKTWELENAGSCTWEPDFQLVFVKGEQMEGDDDAPLGDTVSPGERVKVSVDLTAPIEGGTYRGDWMLQADSGEEFGLGEDADKTFWVSIKVEQADEGVIFSFVNAYCTANWESSSDDDLPCPGDEEDDDGFVIRLEEPDQENRTENEAAIWTSPAVEDDGWITGIYPAIEIEDDDRFIADIGCLDDNEDCDVIFRLSYRIGSGSIEELGEWHEVFDGAITRINIDLSDLEDEKVKFYLTVEANGEYDEDNAFWLNAHIRRD